MKVQNGSFLVAGLVALVLAIGFAAPAVVAKQPTSNKACATEVAACGRCGDGQCVKSCGETPTTCPKDCGVESERLVCGKCGDGRCTPQCGETAQSCPKDCGVEAQRGLALLDN